MSEHPPTSALRSLYAACVHMYGDNWSEDLVDEDYGPCAMWHALYDADVALNQTPPLVEKPEPLIDEFVQVKCIQWNATERVISFKRMMVLRKAEHFDWLRRALAWCEQGEANKEAQP